MGTRRGHSRTGGVAGVVHAGRHAGMPHRAWARLVDGLLAAARELLGLIVPVECAGCGHPDLQLCPACARRLRALTARPERVESHAPALVDVTGRTLLPAVSAGQYRGELSLALLAFKRHGSGALAAELAAGLARALQMAAGRHGAGVLLITVPTSQAAYLRRGFDPLRVLMVRVRREGRLPPGSRWTEALRPRRRRLHERAAERLAAAGGGTRSQKGLGRSQRRARVSGSLEAKPRASLDGRRCLIVDDVLTTGATAREAVRALEAGGAVVLGVITLAYVPLPDAAESAARGTLPADIQV